MKFGVMLPVDGPLASQEAISTVAKEAESLGYSSVWVHDHISRKASTLRYHFCAGALELWENNPEIIPNFYESISTLSYLSGITRQVSLGIAVVSLPFRNPVVLAKQTSTLDQLSKGRVILGVGQGGPMYSRDELQAIGEQRLYPVKKELPREWIEVMRKLWTEPKPSYNGKCIQFNDVELFPKPYQKPTIPIFYGAMTPTGLKRVGRYADGWLALNNSLKEIIERKKIIDSAAKESGRDPSTVRIISEHHTRYSKQGKGQAIKEAERTMTGLAEHMAHATNRPMAPPNFSKNLLGDSSTMIEEIQGFESAGVEQIILRSISFSVDDMLDQMRMFESNVMKSF